MNVGVLEVVSAIYREERLGHLTANDADQFVAALYGDLVLRRLRLIRVNDDQILQTEPVLRALHARPIVKKRPGPVDALLVACALEFDLDDLVLVSSDRDLNALAESFGVKTLDPENPSSLPAAE